MIQVCDKKTSFQCVIQLGQKTEVNVTEAVLKEAGRVSGYEGYRIKKTLKASSVNLWAVTYGVCYYR